MKPISSVLSSVTAFQIQLMCLLEGRWPWQPMRKSRQVIKSHGSLRVGKHCQNTDFCCPVQFMKADQRSMCFYRFKLISKR